MTASNVDDFTILQSADQLHGDSEMFFICTISGRVVFTAATLKSYLTIDLTGRNLNDFIPDAIAAAIVGCAHSGLPYDFRCELLGKPVHGSIEVSESHITVLLFPTVKEGKTFIRQSSLQFLTRELSSCLSLMTASLEVLRGQMPHRPETDMPVAVLNQNVLRLLRLSRNMSDYALFQNGELTIAPAYGDINSFCSNLWQRACNFLDIEGYTTKSVFPAEPVMCSFDEEKLERILLNIISNSIRSDKNRFLRMALIAKENSVSITVTDHGNGIPQQSMGSVFDLHSDDTPRRNPLSGAGFGLALAKAYAELHGGSIVISSSDLSGTAACITLPRTECPETMLKSPKIDYAGGFNHTLLELSTALDSKFFL